MIASGGGGSALAENILSANTDDLGDKEKVEDQITRLAAERVHTVAEILKEIHIGMDGSGSKGGVTEGNLAKTTLLQRFKTNSNEKKKLRNDFK